MWILYFVKYYGDFNGFMVGVYILIILFENIGKVGCNYIVIVGIKVFFFFSRNIIEVLIVLVYFIVVLLMLFDRVFVLSLV